MRKICLIIRINNVFDERFKVTSVPYFIPDFNLFSSELDIFTFKMLN